MPRALAGGQRLIVPLLARYDERLRHLLFDQHRSLTGLEVTLSV
jgi:hypothetical protein